MAKGHDEDAYGPSDNDVQSDWGDVDASSGPPRSPDDLAPSGVPNHYDPTRTKKIYASKSQELQRWVKTLWYRYCRACNRDPVDTLRSFLVEDLYNFFHWMLSERSGRIRKSRTVQTYWNTLTLVRQLETGCYEVAPAVQVEMCGARQNLVEEFGLSTEKDEKPIMRAEDEFELLKTLWESPAVRLQHEQLRVELALMIQLAGITGNRPGALRRLQYKDLKIALLPNPAGGDQPRLVIDFTFEHTKRYLGAKDPNTFPVPDIPREPCLLLCPQTMLLGLLFADEAFAVPGLTPTELFNLRIPPGKRELRIPIKPSRADLPLFRRTEHTTYGQRMSCKAVTENWLRERLKLLGEITGFDAPVKPYWFRRALGEALDSSSHISDPQRNLILQHSSSAVFQHNYLSRYITQDTQAAYRGLEPQTAMIRLASGMSRSIDPQRPRSLTDQQLRKIDRHPEVILARRVRDRLARSARALYTTITRSRGTTAYEAYKEAQRAYLRTKRELRKAMIKQIRVKYRVEQPVADILHQLNRSSTERTKQQVKNEEEEKLSSERQRVLSALLTFAPTEATHDCIRRSEAIDAVRALCKRQESGARKACRRTTAGSDGGPEVAFQATPRGADEMVERDPFPVQCLPTQCIFCMGDEGASFAKRTKSFCNRDGLKRHFFRQHLKHHAAGQRIRCPHPKCYDVWLEHADHMRNHAATVHGTLT